MKAESSPRRAPSRRAAGRATRWRRRTSAGSSPGRPASMPSSSAITRQGETVRPARTRSRSPPCVSTASRRADALARMESARPDRARGEKRRFTSRRKSACSGGSMCRIDGVDMRLPAGPQRVVDQRAAARAEALRVAAEVADVLVAGQRPESRPALVHGVLRAQAGQHLVVVRAGEEGRVPRIDERRARLPAVVALGAGPVRRPLRRSGALVLGHGASVLCSAMRTRCD